MPYRGVPAPGQTRIFKSVFHAHPIETFSKWRSTVLTLWREACFREERYAAIALTGDRRYRRFQTLEALPIYEEMVVTGAWWDYVDAVAIHRVGEFLLPSYRRDVTLLLREWSRSKDLWKRRSSIIAQVALKRETDLDLLYECIERNLSDREFFIRKAIGWALRAYAWIDPEEIRRYAEANETRLSPLSRREAIKNIDGS